MPLKCYKDIGVGTFQLTAVAKIAIGGNYDHSEFTTDAKVQSYKKEGDKDNLTDVLGGTEHLQEILAGAKDMPVATRTMAK